MSTRYNCPSLWGPASAAASRYAERTPEPPLLTQQQSRELTSWASAIYIDAYLLAKGDSGEERFWRKWLLVGLVQWSCNIAKLVISAICSVVHQTVALLGNPTSLTYS